MAKYMDYTKFVTNWTYANDIKDFCRIHGCSLANARYHEKRLREKGVNLKELKYEVLDKNEVQMLNSIISKNSN